MRRFIPVILTAAASLALMAQAADQLPKRKPGLWEMTMSPGLPNAPTATTKMCIDAATDAALYNFGMGQSKQNCSKSDIKADGKTVTADATCVFNGMHTTTHALTKFTGDITYHSDIKMHYDPPLLGRSDAVITQDGKWTGACPADMKPGDMIGPDGRKMNVKQMMGQ